MKSKSIIQRRKNFCHAEVERGFYLKSNMMSSCMTNPFSAESHVNPFSRFYTVFQPSMSFNLLYHHSFPRYYKVVNGCYDDSAFLCMVSRGWETDKTDVRPAIPAAGMVQQSRVDLHHFQNDTLAQEGEVWRRGGKTNNSARGGQSYGIGAEVMR